MTDDDSAIDGHIEEHYQQFDTIFDQIYNEGVDSIGSLAYLSRTRSPA